MKDSSAVDATSIAPGSSRMTASTITSAGSSPPGQHVVTDRQFQVDEVADPVVDAFVARADQDQVLARCQIRGTRLPEDLAAGIERG